MISEKRIDEACRGILEAKFRLGLFENPFVDAAQTAELCNTSEHRATALEAARKSIVLLKNDGFCRSTFRNTGGFSWRDPMPTAMPSWATGRCPSRLKTSSPYSLV